MHSYMVTVTKSGVLVAVHHDIHAVSESEAIEIARLFHPYRVHLTFHAEIS